MISTADRRPIRAWAALLALALVQAGPGGADASPAEARLGQARAALARGDGIAAEAALRKALALGSAAPTVAPLMGEALLDQGDLDHAREWLAPARFAGPGANRAGAAHGWRMLGRLELAQHNLPASAAAFASAQALTPDDSRLWVDIARLRYVSGQELAAIDAAGEALRLDPGNVRALELRGLLVRDRFGLGAALPWFEAGLKRRPDDISLLGEYAATLGELGRTREMLTVTRQMIRQDPDDRQAWFLQATVAARAGDFALARQLLARAGPDALDVPAGLLLSGLLEGEAGNANLAVERLDQLARLQPRNEVVRCLLAHALAATGRPERLIARLADEVSAPGTSPYLLTLVARAYEDTGRRDLAAPLLDRAAAAGGGEPTVLPEAAPLGVLAPRFADAPADAGAAVPYVRKLLAGGDLAGAAGVAERIVAAAPASATAQRLAGDIRMLRGDLAGAVEGYRRAGEVRLSDDLMLRLVEAYVRAGQGAAARDLVGGALATSPRNRTALRLAAGFAAQDGNWSLAAQALDWLARTGDARDARLLADLAVAQDRAGHGGAALRAAQAAFRLQPAAPTAARALGETLPDRRRAAALKARSGAG